jgi:hypothetical protein
MHISKTHSENKNVKSIPILRLIILTILAVAFWRGLWWLFDKYFFPGNIGLSHLLCLIVPIIVVVVWAIFSGFSISWDMEFPIDHHLW